MLCKSNLCCIFLLLFSSQISIALSQNGQNTDDWPVWRGPNRNGIAASNQDPPTTWSEKENIVWKTPIPGKGHGSATVIGQQVFVTTADLESDQQTILSLERKSGKHNWHTTIHKGGLKTKGNKRQNKKASLASTSVASDGKQIFATFLNQEAVWATALTMTGEIVWQKEICKYVVHQGYGASPILFDNMVIVSADNKGGGRVAALRKETGEIVWNRDRPKTPNYPTPALLKINGKNQLFLIGCDLVTNLDPRNGKQNWEIKGATTECVATTVTDGKHIFTSGGYPKNHISAVVAETGKVAWENKSRCYVPSMICKDNHLYAVLDAGVAMCYDTQTGKTVWRERLAGTFSGSTVLVNDNLYAVNEEGTTFIFKAKPDRFKKVGENKLGDSVFSSPAICGSQIFLRVAHVDVSGKNKRRNEFLYCIGK